MVSMQLGDEPSVGAKNLNAAVLPVSDVNVSVVVGAHAGRPLELTNVGAGLAERRLPFAVHVELLNSVVTPVGNVYQALLINADSPRQVELALSAAEAPEFALEGAVQAEFLYSVVVAIGE